MKKKEACELLGVDMKGLAEIVCIQYDSLRSLRVFSPIHVKLIRWEIDKRFIKKINDSSDNVSHASYNHSNMQREIDSLVAKGIENEKARAEDI